MYSTVVRVVLVALLCFALLCSAFLGILGNKICVPSDVLRWLVSDTSIKGLRISQLVVVSGCRSAVML